jgi:hypothetical protein
VKEELKQKMEDEKLTREEEDGQGGAVEHGARRSATGTAPTPPAATRCWA